MHDAVSRAIAERQGPDEGFAEGVLASVVVHGTLALLVLLGASRVNAPLKVAEQRIEWIRGLPWRMPPVESQSLQRRVAEGTTPGARPTRLLRPGNREPLRRAASVIASASSGTAIGTSGASASAPVSDEVSFGGVDLESSSDSWYLAGVRSKVWAVWAARTRTEFRNAVAVEFSIQRDGNVTNVAVVSSSGSASIDLAAQRAIQSAAPFAPLPEHLGPGQLTIRGIFRPDF
jgi:TonB family protein